MSPIRILLLIVFALALAGCPASNEPSVTLKGRRYAVEIMSDPAGHERGLMFREHLDPDRGMLFVFPDLAPRAFWMKNTRIPLDILYFDGDAKFVSAMYAAPPCVSGGNACPSYPSTAPARYVLELNAGIGRALDLKPGDALTLPAR
jgi:uncharacterized membrane protein (UPF0127 family)